MAERTAGGVRMQFIGGAKLFVEAAQRAFRMRNVWILLALCAAADVGARVMEARAEPSFLQAVKLAPQESAEKAAVGLAQRWKLPAALPGNLVHGVQRPLNSSFAGARTPVLRAAHRAFRLDWDPLESPEARPLLLTIVVLNLIYAALTAGALGWVCAAVRGERQDARAFLGALARGLFTIYVWLLVLDTLQLIVYGATSHSSISVAAGVGSGVALALFPLLLLPFRAIARRESLLPAAVGSVRLVASRLALVAGFLVCYRVAAEVVLWLTTAFQLCFPMPSGPNAHSSFGALAAPFAGALLRSAVALVLCTGLMVLVDESPRRAGEEAERPAIAAATADS